MIYSANPKKVHDARCKCDCWPCFDDWDTQGIEHNEEQVKLFVACYACLGAGCEDCRDRYDSE